MDTKLKNSIKQEAILVFACFFWGFVFTVTTNLFTAMGSMHGNLYQYAKICVGIGAVYLLILGIAIVRHSLRYFMAVWGSEPEPAQGIILDKIPIEIAAILFLFFGLSWYYNDYFTGSGFYLYMDEYERHQIYSLVYLGIRELGRQLAEFLLWGVTAWTILRQIRYDCWQKHSLCYFYFVRWRYSICSALGRKLTKRRILFWLFVLLMFGGELLSVLCIDEGDTDVGVFFMGIAVIAQMVIIAYQRFSGVASRDVTALVEQIHAVSCAEPLDKVCRVAPNSMFYEAFQQLESLDGIIARSAEKQLQAERLKIDLITNVSHDLKTPLTSMVGYTDLLKQETMSPEAKDYLDVISEKQELLKEMIQNLFELSKSTSGVDELKMETLDMRKLMEQILGDMEDHIRKSGMAIRTAFADPPLLFAGDNEKMYRVVQNLLENALKYSLDHTRIYIDVKREDERLTLQMKNIAKYEMDFDADEITGRFVRGDRSRTTEGHGLGLAIASSFTQNMGGLLMVEVDGDLFKVTVEFPAVSG